MSSFDLSPDGWTTIQHIATMLAIVAMMAIFGGW